MKFGTLCGGPGWGNTPASADRKRLPRYRLLPWLLESLGVQNIRIAADGQKALEEYRRDRPDLILLDLQMPIMDGLSLARAIREEEAGTENSSVLVAVTAAAFEEDRARAMQAGCDGYLSKPVGREGLIRELARLIPKHR